MWVHNIGCRLLRKINKNVIYHISRDICMNHVIYDYTSLDVCIDHLMYA